jgi:hypothetical protein
VTDFEDVRAETRDALQRVEDGSDPAWLEHAYACLRRTAKELPELISDDVWERGLPETREARALGPVLLRAKREGIITKTDRVRPSVRSHMSGKPVWISNIYKGDPDG